MTKEDKENYSSFTEMSEILTEILQEEPEDGSDPVNWARAVKAFNSSISSIMDELELNDYDYNDLQRLYDKSQNIIKKMQNKIKAAIIQLNKLIELAYEELDD